MELVINRGIKMKKIIPSFQLYCLKIQYQLFQIIDLGGVRVIHQQRERDD